MNQDLQGKMILITGASSGIGAETACELAQRGASLILSARRIDRLEELKEKCERFGGGEIYIFPMDLAMVDQIDRLENFIDKNGLQIDILINNAGFGYAGPFVEMDFNQVENLFQVNVLSLMYLTQKIALRMLDQGKGQIINLASLAGKVATADYAIYAATKAAVISFSNSLRMELKDFGVNLTVINLGPVDSSFFDHIDGKRKEKVLNGFFTLEIKEAAEIVANAVGTSKREVNRPILLNIGAKLHNLAPSLVDQIILKYFND